MEAFFISSSRNMLARIQQLAALSLVCGAVTAFVLGAWLGQPWIGPAFVGLGVAAYAGVLATEFFLLHRSYSRHDSERPRLAQLLKAWVAEVSIAPRVFLWQQPFRSRSEPDHLPDDARGKRGVVLVHGFFCNRGVWNPWLRRLREEGVPVAAVNLEPVLGPIDDYRTSIASAVAAIERATGRAPVIVAHSMGGLAVRAWLARAPEAKIHRLLTIASPHAGTRLAGHARGSNVAQMRQGSAWINVLDTPTSRTQVVCFWSHCDNVVFPTRSATLPGADNRHLPATPHVRMIFHPDVFEEALRSVRD